MTEKNDICYSKAFEVFCRKYYYTDEFVKEDKVPSYDEMDDFDKGVTWHAFFNYLLYIGFTTRKELIAAINSGDEDKQEAMINELDWK